ncbi:MAG: histidinol dehydrogenase [Syntrophomonadaceae bacterium]|jgi:histidinol dehydrogenase|nr:histidinol dehydrogenase [Syntrophomonadaceae bacterium]
MQLKRIEANSEELKLYLDASSADIKNYEARVAEIASKIREQGEQAIFELSKKYDNADINNDNFQVSMAEMEKAYENVELEYIKSLSKAIKNIRSFHAKQLRTSWMDLDDKGNITGQIFRPLERVGIYVPGGSAAYPSSVLMNAIPAQIAGVEQIAMVSPPDPDGGMNPYTLVAASELGISEIYKVGGAQAVFALAWGTDTIKKVDLISGPGNIYVTLAKKLVYGDVDIDMLAGPSEILIVADEKADPGYLAADLLSQAEHDVLARSILVCHDRDLLDRVEKELSLQIPKLSRRDIIIKALRSNGVFIVTENVQHSCEVANLIAPEHMELMLEDPFAHLYLIKNAGAIFMGSHTPEPVGDYYAGPNHILPTGGTARFYSPVTVDIFRKASNLIYYSQKGLEAGAQDIVNLATVEGLTAHANSVKIRLERQ